MPSLLVKHSCYSSDAELRTIPACWFCPLLSTPAAIIERWSILFSPFFFAVSLKACAEVCYGCVYGRGCLGGMNASTLICNKFGRL